MAKCEVEFYFRGTPIHYHVASYKGGRKADKVVKGEEFSYGELKYKWPTEFGFRVADKL